MPIARSLKNVVYNYTDIQRKVREATSNDPWGPSSTIMAEISDATYNMAALQEIMNIIWRRLNDHGKNWRHVYKSLTVLEYIIKTGSDRVTQSCRENIYAVQTLKDFQFIDKDNKDQGVNVREKAKQLVGLLKDDERLKEEREKAIKAKERFTRASGQTGRPIQQSSYPVSHPGNLQQQPAPVVAYHPTPTNTIFQPAPVVSNTVVSSTNTSGNITTVTSVISDAPSTQAEEEMQLNLALAMSRQVAQNDEKQQQEDYRQLQQAIDESMRGGSTDQRRVVGAVKAKDPWSSAIVQPEATSSVWGSSQVQTAVADTTTNIPVATSDPWGSAFVSNQSASQVLKQESEVASTDAWALQPAVGTHQGSTSTDPWPTSSTLPSSNNNITDPWSKTSTSSTQAAGTAAAADPWSQQSALPSIQDSTTRSDPWSTQSVQAPAQSGTVPADPWSNTPASAATTTIQEQPSIVQLSSTVASQSVTDPFSTGSNLSGQAIAPIALISPNNQTVTTSTDPWGATSSSQTDTQGGGVWQSQSAKPKDELDEFSSLRLGDTGTSFAGNTMIGNNDSLLTPTNLASQDSSIDKRKDAKTFLGENSSLVNLDTLVVRGPVADGTSTNPFQSSSSQRPQNPFCQPQQQPSMNQLRGASGSETFTSASLGNYPLGNQPMQSFPSGGFSQPQYFANNPS